MLCENCKNEIKDGSKFCPSCGSPVLGASADQPAPTTEPITTQADPVSPTQATAQPENAAFPQQAAESTPSAQPVSFPQQNPNAPQQPTASPYAYAASQPNAQPTTPPAKKKSKVVPIVVIGLVVLVVILIGVLVVDKVFDDDPVGSRNTPSTSSSGSSGSTSGGSSGSSASIDYNKYFVGTYEVVESISPDPEDTFTREQMQELKDAGFTYEITLNADGTLYMEDDDGPEIYYWIAIDETNAIIDGEYAILDGNKLTVTDDEGEGLIFEKIS